jgi:hypothetical protein
MSGLALPLAHQADTSGTTSEEPPTVPVDGPLSGAAEQHANEDDAETIHVPEYDEEAADPSLFDGVSAEAWTPARKTMAATGGVALVLLVAAVVLVARGGGGDTSTGAAMSFSSGFFKATPVAVEGAAPPEKRVLELPVLVHSLSPDLSDAAVASTMKMGGGGNWACMYQCSQIDHAMDVGSCFSGGCPSDGGGLCFGGMSSPMSHDFIPFRTASDCQGYVSAMHHTDVADRRDAWHAAYRSFTGTGRRQLGSSDENFPAEEFESHLRRLSHADEESMDEVAALLLSGGDEAEVARAIITDVSATHPVEQVRGALRRRLGWFGDATRWFRTHTKQIGEVLETVGCIAGASAASGGAAAVASFGVCQGAFMVAW